MELVIDFSTNPNNQHPQQTHLDPNAINNEVNWKSGHKNQHPSDDLQVRQRPTFEPYDIKDQFSGEEKKRGVQPSKKQILKASPLNKADQYVARPELQDSHNYLIAPEQQHKYPVQSDVIVEVSPQNTKQTIKANNYEIPIQEEPLQPIESATEQASERANRLIGVFILLGMFGILWIYGWASEYTIVTSSSVPVNLDRQSLFCSLFILTAIFTVIGFGLLFMHFKKMSESAIFTSLFITSLTIITSPFLQKFWYNTFITDFSNSSITLTNSSYLLNQSMGGKTISIDLYNLKFSLINAISQLVVMLALFGKINAFQITFFSLFYNIAWSLNHYFLISRLNSSPDSRIFDDYQIASIYLFGGIFALFSSLILKKPPVSQNFTHSNFSSMLAQVGTFFLFLSFCANSILFTQKTSYYTEGGTFVWQQGILNTFFAMAASIMCTYLGSILMAGKIHVRQSVIGTITGAIIYGSIAQICTNIGAALAAGVFAGLFSSFFYHKIYTNLNRRRAIDSLGAMLIAIVSLIGTFGVAPLVIYSYYYYNIALRTLDFTKITNSSQVGYILQYVGITVAIAAVSGLVIGLFLKLFDKFDAEKVFDDRQFVSKNSGLKPGQDKQKSESRVASKSGKKEIKPMRNLGGPDSQKEMNVM